MKRKRRREEEKEEERAVTRSKKAKLGEEDALEKFLALADAGDSIAGLTYFLTTVRRDDSGSALIGAYLQRQPSCESILSPLQWERDRQTHDTLLLCFECLENILLHTASLEASTQSGSGTGMGSSPGHKLAGTVLRDHMRPIYSSLLTTCPMKLVAVCLRLLTAMVLQGHHTARDVQKNFNFSYKQLIVLPNRTHRVKGSSDSVRTYFIRFALSFLIAGDNDVIRNILNLRKFLSSVFKLLPEDPVEIVHLFLSTLRQKVLKNNGVSKKAKSALFNFYALKQLSALLSGPSVDGKGEGKRGERRGESFQVVSQENGEIVSLTLHDYVLDVLTELCTSFQHGVCYRTKTDVLLAERSNNPAILQLLLSLTPSLSDRGVQGLIVRTISTCPDLLTPYLDTVNISFEPRPNPKWVENINFLTKLLSGLSPVLEILGVSGCGQEVPVSLVPVAVRLTVPRAMTRTMLNQGVQSGVPLVKLKTLTLMDVILKRAAMTVHALKPYKSGPTAVSMVTVYTDSVLKLLPELKTLVNLRQRLLAPVQLSVELAKGEGSSLTQEQRICNAALLDDSTLLSQCLVIMRGYQLLSSSLFAQADFNPAKLLPSLSDLQASRPPPPTVLMATLRLLEEAPGDYFKWQQQKSGILSSLLWLVVCGDGETSCTALNLTLKLLLSVDSLSQYAVELSVVLAAARRFCGVCLSREAVGGEDVRETEGDSEKLCQVESRNDKMGEDEFRGKTERRKRRRSGEGESAEGGAERGRGGGRECRGSSRGESDRSHFVRSLVEMLSNLTREPQSFTLSNSSEEAGIGGSSSQPMQSLESILAGPLEIPTAAEVVSLSKEQTDLVVPSSSHGQLLPSVVVSNIDCDKYFPFVCDVVIKLLLAQDDCHSSVATATHLLSLSDKWKSRSWYSLYQSLVALLRHWTGDTATGMEVEAVREMVDHQTSRKMRKKLMKLPTPVGMCAMELFSNMSRQQLLECLIATENRPDLHQALLFCLDLRPLHLTGCHDNPVIQDLLPSLPLSTLVLQSIQLEPTTPSLGGSCPFLLPSLPSALSALPLQVWEDSLLAGAGGDTAAALCAARTMLAVLLELCRSNHVEALSAADVCFHVLEQILQLVLSPKNEPQQQESCLSNSHKPSLPFAVSLVTHTLFTSPLVQFLLTHTHSAHSESSESANETTQRRNGATAHWKKARGESVSRKQRSRAREGSVEGVCIGGVGKLLSAALRFQGEFKRSSCFLSVFEGLLERIVSTQGRDEEDTGRSLLSVLRTVRPCLDLSSLMFATERLLQFLTASPSPPPHPSLVSQALLTLLTPHTAVECASAITTQSPLTSDPMTTLNHPSQCTQSKGEVSINYPTNGVPPLRDHSLRQLLEVSVSCASLAQPALRLVCRRLCVSPAAMSLGKWASLEWSSCRDTTVAGGQDSRGGGGCGEQKDFLLGLKVVAERITAKGLCPSFLLTVCDRFSTAPNSDSWLPNALLSRLLDCCCGRASVSQCSLIGCLLLHLPYRTLEYFSTVCVPELCDCVESHVAVGEQVEEEEEEEVEGVEVSRPSLETALFVLALYLSAVVRARKTEEDDELWKDSVKVVRKSLWKACTALLIHSPSHRCANMQGLSVRLLYLLCQLSPKAKKMMQKLAESWDSQDTMWTRHQVCIVGAVGSRREGDISLCGMAVRRLLSGAVCVTSEHVLQGMSGEKQLSLKIQRSEWNAFVKNVSVRLSSVLGSLCAGVKVMYRESGEEGQKKRRRKEELVTLESLHSMLWSHSEFQEILFSPINSHQTPSTKERLVELLVFVSERCPGVCATSHVPTLLGAYSATCTRADRGLLFLLLLYEINGANIGKFKPYLWGETGRKMEAQRGEVGWLQWQAPGPRQVLESLDTQRMRHTLKHFPQHTPLEPTNPFREGSSLGGSGEREEELVYDPAFLLPLLSHLLDPAGLVECRVVVESGSLSYLLSALSSHITEVRKAATHCLCRFSSLLRASKCREKPQLSLLMRVVKNTLEQEPQRLPSLHTAFCAQVSYVFLEPELPLYVLAGQYLVHKPLLDVRAVPLFHTLLHSITAQHCSERGWLLAVLVSGLQSKEDYHLYQRSKLLPHLMTLYTAPCIDSKARALILQLLLRACSFPVAVSDLVWNHGLLAWLAQITSCSNCDVIQKIVSKVCLQGMKGSVENAEEDESGFKRTVKLPPLLEEELSLTVCRVAQPRS